MDQFGNLTIEDEFERKLNEDELLNISSLSISDSSQKMSANILHKYMQHFPTYPSPLRNSLNFVEAFSDEMEIDEDCEDVSQMQVTGQIKEATQDALPRVSFQLPEYRRKSGEDEGITEQSDGDDERDEVEAVEVLDEQRDSSDKSVKHDENFHGTNVIKALLSPTSLGVAAATKIDGVPLEYPIDKKQKTIKENKSTDGALSASTGWSSSSLKEELRSRSQTQPIHVSINNHHHYYSNGGGSGPQTEPLLYVYRQDVTNAQGPSTQRRGTFELPVPWSESSQPVSKTSYAVMSYLQLFLNCITVTSIFSFITSFIRTLRKDISSTWEHRKLELDFESSQCKNQFLLNECHIKVRPALEEKCQQWALCMDRNNDIFFRARSTLSAKLFGEIINSFIEPIGWKALSVIAISLVVWCFCSNFLLGFARAKSYYGDPTDQLLKAQHQQRQQRLYLEELHSQPHSDGENAQKRALEFSR